MCTLSLKDGQRLVFIGDSITDSGGRGEYAPYGNGYVAIFKGLVHAQAPQLQVEYFNQGIGGDTLASLENRWQEDVIELKPDWLSVLIGINDCAEYSFDGRKDVAPESYAKRYESLLAQAIKLTGCSLILLEPFYFAQIADTNGEWRRVLTSLPDYIVAVHNLAKQFNARLIRTHQIGQEIISYQGAEVLHGDPVHPNTTGHGVIAYAIWQALNDGE